MGSSPENVHLGTIVTFPDATSGLGDPAKRENNRPLAQAAKIIMNFFDGVLGSPGCRFFDPRLASSITSRGHQIIQRSRGWIEAQGQRVIYGDTDSLLVLLEARWDEAGAVRWTAIAMPRRPTFRPRVGAPIRAVGSAI